MRLTNPSLAFNVDQVGSGLHHDINSQTDIRYFDIFIYFDCTRLTTLRQDAY